MENQTAKIFDSNGKFMGKGTILSLDGDNLKIAGFELPEIPSGCRVRIDLIEDGVGVTPCECEIRVASDKEVNADILSRGELIERRNSLKLKTDLTYSVYKILRGDKDINKDGTRINIHNLSPGGMWISGNFDFEVEDHVFFYFINTKEKPILLEAKIIRRDELKEEDGYVQYRYGCMFVNTTDKSEAIILQYLFERQLQLRRSRYA